MEKKKSTRLDKDVWIKAKIKSIQEEKTVEDIINPILRKELQEEVDNLGE